jgi:hypothetical protein
MTLKQPNLLQWNDYLQECIDILENSPDSLPSDTTLSRWATLQRIKDDIALKFEVEDAQLPVGPPTPELEQTLQSLRKRLEQWETHTPFRGSSRTSQFDQAPLSLHANNILALLPLAFHFSQMHVQKIAVRLYYGTDNVEENSPSLSAQPANRTSDMIPTAHIERVRNCLATVHRVLDECLSFTVKDVRTIPTFHFIRIAYSTVALLRLNRGAKKPGSELGRIISPEDTDVDSYVNRLLELMQKAAAEEKCRPAHTFQFALRTIQSWFKHHEHHTDRVQAPTSSDEHKRTESKGDAHTQNLDRELSASKKSYLKAGNPINQSSVPDPPVRSAQYHADLRRQQSYHQQQLPLPQDYQAQPSLPAVSNTPLHLLSQVATDGPPAPTPSIMPTTNAGPWYNHAYPPYATPMPTPYSMGTTPYYPPMTTYPITPFPNNMAPMYQSADAGFGFQQALGVRSGQEIDLCAMFMDGNFLGQDGFGIGDFEWGGGGHMR